MGLVVMVGEIDDPAHVSAGRVTHPDPYELVLFDEWVALHAHAVGNMALTRNHDAPAAAVEGEAMVAALDAGWHDFASGQRCGAVTATVDERGSSAGVITEKNDGLVADAAGQRLLPDLVRPGRDVPSVTNEHRELPKTWPTETLSAYARGCNCTPAGGPPEVALLPGAAGY